MAYRANQQLREDIWDYRYPSAPSSPLSSLPDEDEKIVVDQGGAIGADVGRIRRAICCAAKVVPADEGIVARLEVV